MSAPAGERFRRCLGRMLEAALRAVPSCEPIEGDVALERVDRHLSRAQLFISNVLYPPETQRREREEEDRQRRVLVRQRGLEELLMRVDRDAQRVSEAIVGRQPAPVARIAIDMLLQGMIDLVDRVEVRALHPDYAALHPVSASRDPVVQGIVTLLYDVRRGTRA